jgi:RNA-binding protein
MLTSEIKKNLKSKAHALKPVILLGHNGLTDAVLKEIINALAYHELIKIKLPQLEYAQRQLLTNEILAATHAQLVQSMGRIVTLYQKKEDASDS